MDHKIELEIIGERASNYLRLFLIFIFTAGTVVGHLIENQVSQILGNYVGGIIIYIIATLTSYFLLKANKYTPRVKYYTIGLELTGFSFVLFGFLRLTDPEMLTIVVNDIVLYAIYFLIIAESTLRFSPRFTLLTGLCCTSIFTILGFLIKAQGGDKSVFPVTTLTVVLGALFIFAMTIASYSGTRFVRQIVLRIKNSEENAVEQSVNLKKLGEQTKFTIEELNSIVNKINQVIEESMHLAEEQLQFSESSTEIVNHFSDSINSIASMAKTQEENCQENSKSISILHEVTNKIDTASVNIKDQGKKSIKLAQNGEQELIQSIKEIKNISQASADVSKIVSVINNIAKQTNLLSLNAAIEAARAGEQGKSFEVVANEVSNLANSSGRNSKQISDLISEMNLTVSKGEEQIKSSSLSMQEILRMTLTMSEEVQSINNIVNEQIKIIKESQTRTEKIQLNAQKMKQLTGVEETNSKKLQIDIEKVFSGSKKVSLKIHELQESAEKLKSLSNKLQSNN